MADLEIKNLIPHRDPFLWVDRVVESSGDSITAEKFIPEDLDVFDGHYPHFPLLPGVLICEAIFQTGALLIAKLFDEQNKAASAKIPVLTKIVAARFKRQVRPGETVRMTVKLVERLSSVVIFKGIAKVGGETAVKTEFSCALVEP